MLEIVAQCVALGGFVLVCGMIAWAEYYLAKYV